MTPRREPRLFFVYAGAFASQQLAFAHLLDAADRAGRGLNLDHVEVIAPATAPTRLAAFFDAATAGALRSAANGDTLILISEDGCGAEAPFGATGHLRPLGAHRGAVTRAAGAGSWT